MRDSLFATAAQIRLTVLLLVSGFCLLISPTLQAAPEGSPPQAPRAQLPLPEHFGEVVYQTQTRAAAGTNLYIIANAHRSAISGVSSAETLQAQLETFRIGEWLIRQSQIELLLPEGFFGTLENSLAGGALSQVDNQTLQAALDDDSLFANAELLLHENYGICLDQVEDRKLYLLTRDRLRSTLAPEAILSPALSHELAYLQKLRTANFLQRAPSIIASAYRQGRISSPRAMLTIGLSHLDDLIGFLKAGEIDIAALQTAQNNFPALATELEVIKEQVGVTVIVPRSLIARQNGDNI